MPAWRTASSRAASRGVRSGSSPPASAVSAMPMPTPATACGAIVHTRLASGSQASASTPPPTSRQPAAARERGSPGTRAPITAAIGSTETASAASSGGTLQPATSSSTSRNSTAVSAAETSASASAGARAAATRAPPARRRLPARPARRPRPPAPTGTPTRKIARQSKASVSAPPSAGPIAVASTAAPSHSGGRGRRHQQLEDDRQPRRAAQRLHHARGEQHRQAVGARAREARQGEEREAAGADDVRADSGAAARSSGTRTIASTTV